VWQENSIDHKICCFYGVESIEYICLINIFPSLKTLGVLSLENKDIESGKAVAG
jgi:hypothetical protein